MAQYTEALIVAIVESSTKITWEKVGKVLQYRAGIYQLELIKDVASVYEFVNDVKTQKISVADDKIKAIYESLMYQQTEAEADLFTQTIITYLNSL